MSMTRLEHNSMNAVLPVSRCGIALPSAGGRSREGEGIGTPALSRLCPRIGTPGPYTPTLSGASGGLHLHARSEAEIHADEGNGVAEAVRQDGRPQIAPERQIEAAEHEPADRGIDDAGRALIEMAEAE